MIAITLMLTTASVRLYSLMSDGAELVSTRQGSYTLTVARPRGTVYDCNMRRLTNTTLKTVAVLPPTADAVAAVSRYLGDNAEAVLNRLKSGKPILTEVPSDFECSGAYKFTIDAELASDQLACHLIGYVDGTGNGVTGIQYACNDLLNSASPLKVTYTVDASGRPLAGIEAEVSGQAHSDGGVILTIDSQIQRICEISGESLKKGAVVVMESDSGKLRALASFPAYSPNDVAASLNDESAPLVNRALAAYNVGSVFKLCVCTAALRNGVSTATSYDCTGFVNVGNTRFNCNKHNGHGVLDMTSGLAKSCNCYFINLARSVGAASLYDTCLRFGFNRAYTLGNGITAADGVLPKQSEVAAQPAALANLSFGQGDLMLTPLHIAVMTAAIANGGMLVTPSVIDGTTDGDNVTPADIALPRQILTKSDTEALRLMMEAVVSDGTGAAAKPEIGVAGGKTATAETGWYIDGRAVIQSWFAGFYGDYTVVVVKEDGTSGSADCAPVFKAICDAISEL